MAKSLEWYLKHGDKLEFYEAMEEKTGKTPAPLLDKPSVDTTVQWYLDAFFLLTNSRNTGMSVGRIPLSEITNYGLVFGTIEDDLRSFCYVINAMDDVYLKHVDSQKPKKGVS